MRVYSPSSTSNWLRCPVYRELASVRKLRSRVMTKRDMAAILGTAIAAGVGAHHMRRMHETPPAPLICGKIARVMADRHMATALEMGRTVAAHDQAQWHSIPDRADLGTALYIERDPIPHEWILLGVEKEYPEYGHCRLDLVVDDGYGPAVVDLKVKLTLDPRYKQREIDRYKNHWNMMHYHWVLSQLHERVSPYYYIAFAVLEPKFTTWIEQYVVHPESLLTWEQSARRVWRLMEASDTTRPLETICMCVLQKERKDGRPALTADPSCPACGGKGIDLEMMEPWMVAEHSDNFGLCEFYGVCFEAHFDPRYITQHFVTEEEACVSDST